MRFEPVNLSAEQFEEFVGAVEVFGPAVDDICQHFMRQLDKHAGPGAAQKIALKCVEEDVMDAVASVWPDGPAFIVRLCITALGAKNREEAEQVWTSARPATVFIWNATWDALAEKFIGIGKETKQ